MQYADFRSKKLIGMSLIALTLALFVVGTATVWTQNVGVFSVRAVEVAFVNGFSSWQYRLQFNWQFGAKPAPGAESLLALVGLVPPIASSQTITPAQTSAQAVPILLYHGILPTSDNTADVTTIDNFKAQMFALKNAGWQTVTMADFIAAMKGEKTLPPKSFLLTFDDGRKDAYYNATPILQALGYHAVMFVIAGHSLDPDDPAQSYYLSDDELIGMAASGVWDIESHSDIGHAEYPIDASGDTGNFYSEKLWVPTQNPGETDADYATRVDIALKNYFLYHTKWSLASSSLETDTQFQNRVAGDLINAKQLLESKLGISVTGFAYPFNDFAIGSNGNFAQASTLLTSDVNAIYAASFYQWYPSLGFSENYPGADGQLMKRIEPKPDWSPDDLIALLDAGQAKTLPYAMSPAQSDDWQPVWGNVIAQNGTLSLGAASSSSGASTVLDGSRLWSNYDYEIKFDWQKAQSISLFSRYEADPINPSYLACNFGNGSVRLENRESATTTVIAQKKNAIIAPGAGRSAGMRVVGSYAECLWNGGVVAGGYLPPTAPATGGIGLEIWDPALGSAAATITDVSAQAAGQ